MAYARRPQSPLRTWRVVSKTLVTDCLQQKWGRGKRFPVHSVLFPPINLGSDSSVFNFILLLLRLPSNNIKISSLVALGTGISGPCTSPCMEPACLLPHSSLRLLETRACVEWIRGSALQSQGCLYFPGLHGKDSLLYQFSGLFFFFLISFKKKYVLLKL